MSAGPKTRLLRLLAVCLSLTLLAVQTAPAAMGQSHPASATLSHAGQAHRPAPAPTANALTISQPPAAPAPRTGDIPSALQEWVPWAMQGHEMLACPGAADPDSPPRCVWPER